MSLPDDPDGPWATNWDTSGTEVMVKLSETTLLPICGEATETGDSRCVIMLYDGRRHDCPCIMYPVGARYTIVEVRRVARPTQERDLDG